MKQTRVSLCLTMAAVLCSPVGVFAQQKRLAPRSCPPFYLRDEAGNIINPLKQENLRKEAVDLGFDPDMYTPEIPPYSPHKTCGACHNYNVITSGYHFRMGSDVLNDGFGQEVGQPASVSDGQVGKFSRMYFLQFPPKDFERFEDVDVDLYHWAARCGTCHPGGGALEYDRNGHRLDIRQSTDMGLSQLRDGDYWNAHWDKSGVLEADCLMCHLKNYSYQTRYDQVQLMNYRWAPTAGAVLGVVRGSVAGYLINQASMPTVQYDKSLFLPDGKAHLPIIRKTPDQNCLFCHDLSFVEKHGTTFGDPFSVDVHSQRGIQCIDCHPGGLSHNFAKGDSHELTVRDDLDAAGPSCEECHTQGRLGAPKMEHEGLPPVHLEKIGCEVCHVPTLRVQAIGMVDASMGKPITITSSEGPWFGYRDGETLVPLWYSDIKPVLHKILENATPEERKALQDADGDGMPDFNTKDEIQNALETFYKEPKFKNRQLVFVRKDRVKTFAKAFTAFLVYEIPPSGGLTYKVFRNIPSWRPKYGDVVSEWRPTYAKGKDGKIHAYNNQTAIWWGQKEGNLIRPLFLREIAETIDTAAIDEYITRALAKARKANDDEAIGQLNNLLALKDLKDRKKALGAKDFKKAKDALLDGYAPGEEMAKDDNGDGKREINTDTEIDNFAKMLTKYLSGKRFKTLHPVLVSGTKAYEPGPDGKVKSFGYPLAKSVMWSVSHNVAPREDALGANGDCEECHSPDSYFFFGKALLDPYDTSVKAKPVKANMIDLMGYPEGGPESPPVVVQTSQFFKWLTIVVMALLVLHIVADLIRRAMRKKSHD